MSVHQSIHPSGPPKATVTTEDGAVIVTVRAPLSVPEARELASAITRAVDSLDARAAEVERIFRRHEEILHTRDHEADTRGR